jgi:hypothetical protein
LTTSTLLSISIALCIVVFSQPAKFLTSFKFYTFVSFLAESQKVRFSYVILLIEGPLLLKTGKVRTLGYFDEQNIFLENDEHDFFARAWFQFSVGGRLVSNEILRISFYMVGCIFVIPILSLSESELLTCDSSITGRIRKPNIIRSEYEKAFMRAGNNVVATGQWQLLKAKRHH